MAPDINQLTQDLLRSWNEYLADAKEQDYEGGEVGLLDFSEWLRSSQRCRAISIDRPHRFEVGDRLLHVDTAPGDDPIIVRELTWRIRGGSAYPTYTCMDPITGEDFGDLLDTDDLVQANPRCQHGFTACPDCFPGRFGGAA